MNSTLIIVPSIALASEDGTAPIPESVGAKTIEVSVTNEDHKKGWDKVKRSIITEISCSVTGGH